jgi:hypothetical protein
MAILKADLLGNLKNKRERRVAEEGIKTALSLSCWVEVVLLYDCLDKRGARTVCSEIFQNFPRNPGKTWRPSAVFPLDTLQEIPLSSIPVEHLGEIHDETDEE